MTASRVLHILKFCVNIYVMSSHEAFLQAIRQEMPYIEPLERARAYVDMDQTGITFLHPQSKLSHKVFTDGLIGCTAAALIATYDDGARFAYLQHFHPERHAQGQTEIENVLRAIEHSGALLAAGVVYTPGEKRGLFRPEHIPKYPWVHDLFGTISAATRGKASVLLRSYPSPGREHSLAVSVSTKRRESGIVLDQRSIASRL